MRQGSSICDRAIHELLGVVQVYRFRCKVVGKHVETDFGRGEVLAEAIVQFACNTASFLILHS